MMTPIPSTSEIASQLLLEETQKDIQSGYSEVPLLRVFEKLRIRFSQIVGISGYHLLLSRSLTLARRKVEWLNPVHVSPEAHLEGWEPATSNLPPEIVFDGSVILLAGFLQSLFTFIGPSLTFNLILDIWAFAFSNRDERSDQTDRDIPDSTPQAESVAEKNYYE